MTWGDSKTLLEKLFLEGEAQLETMGGKGSLLEQIEPNREYADELEALTDSAISRLAKDLKWPNPIEKDVLIFALIRLKQAQALLEFVCPANSAIPLNHAVNRVVAPDIRWLLVDYWKHAGMIRSMRSCFDPQNPNPY